MLYLGLCNVCIDNPTNASKEELVDSLLNFLDTDTVLFFGEVSNWQILFCINIWKINIHYSPALPGKRELVKAASCRVAAPYRLVLRASRRGHKALLQHELRAGVLARSSANHQRLSNESQFQQCPRFCPWSRRGEEFDPDECSGGTKDHRRRSREVGQAWGGFPGNCDTSH